MDFIPQLPRTPRGHDSITVFVDRLTKMVHLAPGKTTDDAPTVARQFLNNVFRLHGLPNEIISDRSSIFTSCFWKAFLGLLDTRVATSTAFHPQTDGQTERVNRVVEQMLRFWVNYKQTNWDLLLPLVEFAINNHKHASTQHTPFFLNYGQHPRAPSNAVLSSFVPHAKLSHDELRSTLSLVKDLLRSAQDRMATFANEKRTELTFDVGEQVLLSSANVTEDNQSNRPSRKLAPSFISPYTILECVGPVAYKLDLPPTLPIHPTIHISRLRPYSDPLSFDPLRPTPPQPPPVIVADNPEWEIEEILDKRIKRKRTEYLVKWTGYDDKDNTWVLLKDMDNAMELVKEFEASLPSSSRAASS